MIIQLNENVTKEDIEKISKLLEDKGFQITYISGKDTNVIGVLGDTEKVAIDEIESYEFVKKVVLLKEPYKKASRLFHPEDTIIDVKGIKIGGGNVVVMAGPCSVENREQIVEIAKSVKYSGAKILRGGAYKPRTSPYAFQGLELEGLELLKEARKETGMPIVTEIMSSDLVDKFVEDVDIIQVGARNMQNYDLLKKLGKIRKPILLKRGLSATIEELLMAAEYIMAGGNNEIILCERGIRTYETYTRNTLDISAIPILKKLTHLPIIVDPSHASGKYWLVNPLSKAALAAGADGLIIEVHNDPTKALCDGPQSLKPEKFQELMKELKVLGTALGMKL